jgi:hypothetical protein
VSSQRKVAKIIDTRSFTINQPLRRDAEWTYTEARRIMRTPRIALGREKTRMTDETGRREKIKLGLEYVKIAISLAGVVTIVLAVWQWQMANVVAKEAAYQRIASEWRDHLKTFVDKPDLRPYFEEGKALDLNYDKAQAVLAVADLRLDTADAILTYAALHGASNEIGGWKSTFARAFQTSPTLCARLKETKSNYGLVVEIADAVCPR